MFDKIKRFFSRLVFFYNEKKCNACDIDFLTKACVDKSWNIEKKSNPIVRVKILEHDLSAIPSNEVMCHLSEKERRRIVENAPLVDTGRVGFLISKSRCEQGNVCVVLLENGSVGKFGFIDPERRDAVV